MSEIEKLERRVRLLSMGLVLLCAAWIFGLIRPVNAAANPEGVERVVLSAPAPDSTQVVTIYANAKEGASLSLNNEKGDGASLISWKEPSIQLRAGKKVFFEQPPGAADSH